MLKLLVLTFSLSYTANAGCSGAFVPKSLNDIKAIEAFLKPRLAPKAVPAKLLAPEIKRLSKLFGVPGIVIAKVLIVESRGIASAQSSTGDYGIMQVNAVHQVSQRCLNDWKCNLAFGVYLLSRVKKTCQYNTGLHGSLRACAAYERKLAAL